jgi:hypothetical protein
MTQCAVFSIVSQIHGHNIQSILTTLRDDRGKRSPTNRLHTDRTNLVGESESLLAAGEAKRCADKDETLVRYSVLSESQQLFASKYRLVLPSEEELQAELERRHILDWPQSEGGETR